jgi:hypothetical protein
MFNTLNMTIRMSFIAVVIAIAAIGAVLEIGIINGSQAQVLQKHLLLPHHNPLRPLLLLLIPVYHQR